MSKKTRVKEVLCEDLIGKREFQATIDQYLRETEEQLIQSNKFTDLLLIPRGPMT